MAGVMGGGAGEFGGWPLTVGSFPNADAVRRALAIYRDQVSDFIVRVFRRLPGQRLEQAVLNSLPEEQRDRFCESMRERADVRGCIEVAFVPHLVERNWTELFRDCFANSVTIRQSLRFVRDVAEELARLGGGADLPLEVVERVLVAIGNVLNSINRPEHAQHVLGLLGKLRPDPAGG